MHSSVDHKFVIVSVQRPRTGWHFIKIDEAPGCYRPEAESQVIPHCRRDAEAGVSGRESLVPENVLPIVCAAGSAIGPLREAGSARSALNLDPAILADALALLPVSFPEPWDDHRRLRLGCALRHVIVRELAIEGIQPGCKLSRNVVVTKCGERRIHTAKIAFPIGIPGTPSPGF